MHRSSSSSQRAASLRRRRGEVSWRARTWRSLSVSAAAPAASCASSVNDRAWASSPSHGRCRRRLETQRVVSHGYEQRCLRAVHDSRIPAGCDLEQWHDCRYACDYGQCEPGRRSARKPGGDPGVRRSCPARIRRRLRRFRRHRSGYAKPAVSGLRLRRAPWRGHHGHRLDAARSLRARYGRPGRHDRRPAV